MRILRLDGDGWSVELHPYVTVLAGLDDDQRTAIGAAFQSALRGRLASLTGLIEVHGVVLDLDETSLGLLDLDDVDVDAVVEPTDLPGAASAGLVRQLRAAERRLEALEVPYREQGRAVEAARAAVDEARAAADAARAAQERAMDAPDPDDELARIEDELETATAALAALAEPGGLAAGELEQAERALAEVHGDGTVDVDERRAGELVALRRAFEDRRRELHDSVDEGAADAFEAALAELGRLEAAAAALADADTGDGADDQAAEDADPDVATDDPEAVERRIEELRGLLALHASFDPHEVRAALDAIRLTPTVGEMVPSPEALSLADRLEAADRRVAELEAGAAEAPVPGELEAAVARLDEIRSELLAVERSSAPSSLEADLEELERAHAAVTEARERLDGRGIAKGRAQARYDEAVAAEEAVLDRLGIRSYTDYLTGGRAALYADAEPDELRELRRREQEAEAELQALQARTQHALDLAAAGQDRRELRGRARTLLGDPDIDDLDLNRALLALRVPAEAATPLDELLDALEGVGLPVRSLELGRADAEAMAADWLDEYYRAEERRAALEHELARLESGAPLGADEATFEVVADGPAPSEPAELGPEELDELLAEAQERVRDAKDRMIAHETALREIEEIDVELEAIEGEERRADAVRLRAEDAQRRVERAAAAVADLDQQRQAAEREVGRARAALEQHRATPPAVARAAAAVADADADLARAEQALRDAVAALDGARAGYDAAVEEVAALRQALTDVADEPAPVEEIEWYLLARLAAQRQVSFAGSVPIVLDRALDAVEDDGVVHLLERLERMAGAVQVVHLTDDHRIVRWASECGEERAAVARPSVASTSD